MCTSKDTKDTKSQHCHHPPVANMQRVSSEESYDTCLFFRDEQANGLSWSSDPTDPCRSWSMLVSSTSIVIGPINWGEADAYIECLVMLNDNPGFQTLVRKGLQRKWSDDSRFKKASDMQNFIISKLEIRSMLSTVTSSRFVVTRDVDMAKVMDSAQVSKTHESTPRRLRWRCPRCQCVSTGCASALIHLISLLRTTTFQPKLDV